MNWLDFWASIVGSIASLGWPAAVFGGLYLFRSALRDAIPKLRLKHGETEISVQLQQAEQQAARLPVTNADSVVAPEEIEQFKKLADISPRAAILEARANIDNTVRELARKAGLAEVEKRSAASLVRELSSQSVIDKNTSMVLNDLRTIGNAAAHDPAIDLKGDGAERFGRLASKVLDALTASILRL